MTGGMCIAMGGGLSVLLTTPSLLLLALLLDTQPCTFQGLLLLESGHALLGGEAEREERTRLSLPAVVSGMSVEATAGSARHLA